MALFAGLLLGPENLRKVASRLRRRLPGEVARMVLGFLCARIFCAAVERALWMRSKRFGSKAFAALADLELLVAIRRDTETDAGTEADEISIPMIYYSDNDEMPMIYRCRYRCRQR